MNTQTHTWIHLRGPPTPMCHICCTKMRRGHAAQQTHLICKKLKDVANDKMCKKYVTCSENCVVEEARVVQNIETDGACETFFVQEI